MMYTLTDYLHFRGDIPFDVAPVNEIDEMVFSSMGKANFTGVFGEDDYGKNAEVFGRFYVRYEENGCKSPGLLESPILIETLKKIAECPRYKDIEIADFVNKISTEETEQISALTIFGPDGRIYVTFRGTDDTLVGWKENFDLAFKDIIPAQRDALEYLEKIAGKFDGKIVLSGHSKGGNLAVYAAALTSEAIQQRIEKIISYDGPGFFESFLKSPGYLRIKNRVQTIVTKNSIVGMLMEHAGEFYVVECEKDGIAAHDIFYWNVEPWGFAKAPALSEKSLVMHQAIDKTLSEMDLAKRQEVVDGIFDVLTSTGASNLLDFSEHSVRQALRMSVKLQKSKEVKQFFLMLSKFTLKGAMSTTIGDITEKLQDKVIEPVKERIEDFIE